MKTNVEKASEALLEILNLFKAKTPYAEWPETPMGILRTAMAGEGEGREAQKAKVLRKHLFKDAEIDCLPKGCEIGPEELFLVDRIRADLAGLVPLHAGLKLALRKIDSNPREIK